MLDNFWYFDYNSAMLNLWQDYIVRAIICARFVNVKSGGPAAVFGFLVRVKVVERIQPESTAVGLLRDLSLGVS